MKYTYRVTKQFTKDTENDIAIFTDHHAAIEYIQWCLERDIRLKLEAVYRLYDEKNNAHTFSSQDVQLAKKHQATVLFRPVPFPKPPGGIPYTLYTYNDEDDIKDK